MIRRRFHCISPYSLPSSSTSLSPRFWKPPSHSQRARAKFITSRKIVIRSTVGANLILFALSVVVVGGAIVVNRNLNQHSLVPLVEQARDSQILRQSSVMSTTLLPGRPDNLTADQEKKLKEFWIALFHVFDVEVQAARPAGDSAAVQHSKDVSAKTPEKKDKTKRASVFGKKTPEKGAKTDGVGEAAQMEGEDKYGQGKEYQEVLDTHSREELRQAFWSMVKMDNPDGLLLRFLRARKWSVQNALVMLMATIRWRLAEVKVDSDIIKRGEEGALIDSEGSDVRFKKEGHDFLEQMRIGKSFIHGTDKDGRPMCFVRVRLHRAGEQTESSLERYTVYTIESARLLLHDDVDTAAIVFDMTDFSMANMDYAPVKFMIKCFEANYPESLGVVLVHKSPWIFQSIWKIIRGWLDPVVAGKVHFTKNIDELSKFIPLDHIIHEMGGKDPWTYSFVPPKKGENAALEDTSTRDTLLEKRALIVKEFENVTIRWLQGDEAEVQKQRKVLKDDLRTGYWELDPYLRARTSYDRTGVIQPGGRKQFYPSSPVVEPVANGGPVISGDQGDDDVD